MGVSVVVDGVDVVAAAKEKGQRIHYCPYCKKTLTRPCQKQKCKDLKDGKKVMDPEASDDEQTLMEEQNEPITKPPVNSLIQVDIETGSGSKKCVETFYCTVQEYEDDGAVILVTQDGETMNVILEDFFGKQYINAQNAKNMETLSYHVMRVVLCVLTVMMKFLLLLILLIVSSISMISMPA